MSYEPWMPWEKYRKALKVIEEVKEPPCKHCKLFALMPMYNGVKYDGVIACHAETMHKDFSCFEEGER